MTSRNYLTVLFLLCIFAATGSTILAAPVAEAESNSTKETKWGWYYNQTADQINAAKANGNRPVQLIPNGEIEAVPRYHVLYVKNSGDYKVDDWTVVIRTMENAATIPSATFRSSGWRVTNIALHEVKVGNTTAKRAATIAVKDNLYLDYDARAWLTYNELIALGNQYRIVDIDSFETNGTTYFSAVMVPNKGANFKNWGWLFNTTRSNILSTAKNINGKKYRITDIERLSNGNYNAILVETKGEANKWYVNQTDATLKNDVLRRHGSYSNGQLTGGARFIDLIAYKDGNATKYEVLTMENGVGDYPVSHDNASSLAGIDEAFKKVLSRHGIPGGTFALSKNGKVVYRAAIGYADLAGATPATTATRGRIASITKTITTAALMKLWENDPSSIDLDNKVFAPGGYLSSLKPFDYQGYQGNTVPNLEKITLRHLLNHTAGWDRQKSGDPNAPANAVCDGTSECEQAVYILPRILAHAKKQGTESATATQLTSIDNIIRYMIKPDDKDYLPVYAPGTKFAYSNFGFTCIQKIIELKSGKPYDQYIKEMGDAMGVEFLPGRSRPENKWANEWTYHDVPGAKETTNVSWSSVPLTDPVPSPYTRDMKMLLGHGGFVVSPDDLVKFVSKIDGTAPNPWLKKSTFMKMMERPAYKKDSPTDPYYALCWRVEPMGTDTDEQFRFEHGGSLGGSSSLTLKGWNHRHVTMAYLFNFREDAADGEIRAIIEPIIAAKDDDGTLGGLAK